MNFDTINALTSNGLSNYEGNRGAEYTGFGDDFIDFGGKNLSFASEIATDRVYSMFILNNTAVTKNVLICPSYSPTLSGANDHVVVEGLIVTDLTAAGSPKSITNFLAFINLNPTSVVAFKISSNNTAQLGVTMQITRKSPFRDLENELIVLSSYTTEMNQNDKMVTVRRPFQFDNQTQITLPVPPASGTTITFYCGAVLNTARALFNKSSKAGQNEQVAAARNLVAAQ